MFVCEILVNSDVETIVNQPFAFGQMPDFKGQSRYWNDLYHIFSSKQVNFHPVISMP